MLVGAVLVGAVLVGAPLVGAVLVGALRAGRFGGSAVRPGGEAAAVRPAPAGCVLPGLRPNLYLFGKSVPPPTKDVYEGTEITERYRKRGLAGANQPGSGASPGAGGAFVTPPGAGPAAAFLIAAFLAGAFFTLPPAFFAAVFLAGAAAFLAGGAAFLAGAAAFLAGGAAFLAGAAAFLAGGAAFLTGVDALPAAGRCVSGRRSAGGSAGFQPPGDPSPGAGSGPSIHRSRTRRAARIKRPRRAKRSNDLNIPSNRTRPAFDRPSAPPSTARRRRLAPPVGAALHRPSAPPCTARRRRRRQNRARPDPVPGRAYRDRRLSPAPAATRPGPPRDGRCRSRAAW